LSYRLPEAVFHRFFDAGNKSLLIKGEPGTGKTILSLTMTKWLKPKGMFYLSTRLSEDQIVQEIPWLGREIPSLKIKDVRFGTPEMLVEQYSVAIKQPGSLIILDSWDTFARLIPQAELLKTEQALVTLVSSLNTDTKVVFISETNSATPFDYTVDGVIHLYNSTFHGRTLRVMEFKKLRGIRVHRRFHIFTLDGAKVKIIPPYIPWEPSGTQKLRPVYSNKDSAFATGNPKLDQFYGGIPRGSLVVVEMSESFPYEAARGLTLNLTYAFLKEGRSVLWAPHMDRHFSAVRGMFQSFFDEQTLKGRLRVVDTAEGPAPGGTPFFMRYMSLLDELRGTSKDRCVLQIVSGSFLERLYAESPSEFIRGFEDLTTQANTRGDPLLVSVRRNSPISAHVRSFADIYLALHFLYGSVVLRSERPYYELLAMNYDARNPLIPKITPLV